MRDAPESPLVPAVFATAEEADEERMEVDDAGVRDEPSGSELGPPDATESLAFRSSVVAAVRLFWDQGNAPFVCDILRGASNRNGTRLVFEGRTIQRGTNHRVLTSE